MTNASAITELQRHTCFGGVVSRYVHESVETRSTMRFSVFAPSRTTCPAAVVYYLPGMTCTDETFMIKSGAQRVAAELGLFLVACDTSPRDVRIAGDDEHWDFGVSAGFYVDATERPWSEHYRMFSYVTRELPAIVSDSFRVRSDRCGIAGDSMGGHGALVCGLRDPDRYRSISALAPLTSPSTCSMGQKAFSAYLGPRRDRWEQYDACVLVGRAPCRSPILIDQGADDIYLEDQLKPWDFVEAARVARQPVNFRMHPGYGHDWYFISSFIEDHLRFHAMHLRG